MCNKVFAKRMISQGDFECGVYESLCNSPVRYSSFLIITLIQKFELPKPPDAEGS